MATNSLVNGHLPPGVRAALSERWIEPP